MSLGSHHILLFAVSTLLMVATTQPVAALEMLQPDETSSTVTSSAVNLLGETDKDASITVNGEAAKVFSSGIFVMDQVPLQQGANSLDVVEIKSGAAASTVTLTVNRVQPTPAQETTASKKLLFVKGSLEPAGDVILQPGEVLPLAIRATSGHTAIAQVAGQRVALEEQRDPATQQLTGEYRANFVVPEVTLDIEPAPVQFSLRAAGVVEGPSELQEVSSGKVGFWSTNQVRLMRVTSDWASVAYGIHEVRLGGPYMGELSSGTLVRITGKKGSSLRVRLADTLDGWISESDLKPAPVGTAIPYLTFTSVSVGDGADGDVVSIPYGSPVPFIVSSDQTTSAPPIITVEFFGGHHAGTWLSHSATASLVREVRVEQKLRDRVCVKIELAQGRLWGYKVDVTPGAVRIRVRKAPVISNGASPLSGLLIALEPGHGGPRNLGAVGATRVPEKEINRMTVEALKAELEAAGARTVVVREGDDDPDLGDRTRRALESNADIFISVHANSAGTSRGYLRVSGTSTYYKHSASLDLSAAIHRHLLQETGLGDFGNVGSFNYTPIRANTWMPSMLVEQAFMSNPEDEAKMLDPEFRKKTARGVRLGIEEFLRQQ